MLPESAWHDSARGISDSRKQEGLPEGRPSCHGYGGGDGSRTRVRRHSAFGSTCLVSLFDLTRLPPMNRLQQCDSLSFNLDLRDVGQDDPVYTGSFSIHLEQAQRYHEQLMQLERSCRRLRLYICNVLFTRYVTISACTSGFATSVECQNAPITVLLLAALLRCHHNRWRLCYASSRPQEFFLI